MKKINIFVLIIFVSFASCGFLGKKDIEVDNGGDKDRVLLELLSVVLNRAHYKYVDINDEYSEKVYKAYIDLIDGQKRYFTKEDIDEFKKYSKELDDQLKDNDISFFELTYSRMDERKKEVEKMFSELIKENIVFDKNGKIDLDYEKLNFVQNEKELRERWRDIIRFSVLSNMSIKSKEEENKKKKDQNYKEKGIEEIKKESVEATKKAFEDMFFVMKDINREDWFSMYANSFVEVVDPHTSYMAPDNKERFNKDMAGKFEGIGAQLQKKIDGVKIVAIISGGPVWKGKLLEEGDMILKVSNDGKPAVDIVGMRLNDVVKMIKGPKGTTVVLTVKKVDGSIKEVKVVRDIVELEETFAKSAMVEEGGHKYGVIYLPKFYTDFENPKSRNCYTDMVKEVEKLKKENAQGIVLDLRNNGGGSLREVVRIAGMFIKKGPVVQVRDRDGEVNALEDKDATVQWDKPLVILINGYSASASEILAAAMQDYNRAIIMGSEKSYGKGTVQQMLDLNSILRDKSIGDMGGLMLTIQKFYRINGGSTQLKGVSSDIVIPEKYKYIEIGEGSLDYPLEWDSIESCKYDKYSINNKEKVIANSKKRIAENAKFTLMDEYAKWMKAQSDDNVYPLDYELYKKKILEQEKMGEKFKILNDYKSGLKVYSLKDEEEQTKQDADLKMRRDRWHEILQKDLIIDEAVKVLKDVIGK